MKPGGETTTGRKSKQNHQDDNRRARPKKQHSFIWPFVLLPKVDLGLVDLRKITHFSQYHYKDENGRAATATCIHFGEDYTIVQSPIEDVAAVWRDAFDAE